MNIEMNTIRLLGAVQLIVIIGSVVTESLLATAVGSGKMPEILVNISENLPKIRVSNMVAFGLSTAVVLWGVLYYVVFNKEYQIIALAALGLFLAAAISLGVSKIGANGLIQ